MGMDLLGVGFTVDVIRKDDVPAALDWIERVDPNEPQQWDFAGFGDMGDDVREHLRTGLQEYLLVLSSRMSVAYKVGESDLTFIFTGGGSWGDDPFDGFTSLSLFIDALEAEPALRALVPSFVGTGVCTKREG